MRTLTRNKAMYAFTGVVLLASCLPRATDGELRKGSRSRMSSITMPMPERIKGLIGEKKINSYSLVITPGACDAGVTGTKIDKMGVIADASGASLANEKLRSGCAYTMTISLGQADANASTINKIYLTNDADGKRTEITADQTRSAKIKVTAYLFVTDDGKKDLGIDDQAIPVPSTSQTDVDIGIEVGQNGQNLGGDYEWRRDVKISTVPEYSFGGRDYGSGYYKDVMTHTPAGERDFQSGPSTHAHETLHGLHNSMRNATAAKDGFFYIESGMGIYIVEPKENLRDVKNHIGESFKQLASSRYKLYLIDQAASWTNTLYIFDEWNAYVGTTRSAVEIKRAGQWDGSTNSDPVEGLVDFMYFCSASIISIKNVDPDYLKNNTQFKAGFAMIMEESVKWMNAAKNDWPNSQAWNKMRNFQTAADGAEVRAAVKELMGDAWSKRVLGF